MKQMQTSNQFDKPGNEGRPLVTFFLFAYNQEKYIEEACKAALAQTYSPLEIILSDDCSSDKTFELIEGIVKDYDGPHKVILNRNQKNLGLIGHVNKSFEISSGELIVVAAGDDISLPHRVKCLVDAYKSARGEVLVIHSSATKIDDLNIELGTFIPPIIEYPMNLQELAGCLSLYIGATAAWSRSLYTQFGPILFKNAYEDLVLGFRAALKDSLIYVDKPLVRYRVGVGISSPKKVSIFKFKMRIANRKKKLQMPIAVFEQRLQDMKIIGNSDEYSALNNMLNKNINLQRTRLFFYNNQFALFRRIFSNDFKFALRSFHSEIKFLVGLNE